jgi:hypothetical protein
MLGQLDRLISFSQLPNVRLGIIAFETQYATSPWHGFWLYDNERVLIETFSAALDLRQPQEIELYMAMLLNSLRLSPAMPGRRGRLSTA